MNHLICSLPVSDQSVLSVSGALSQLEEAHQFLVERCQVALTQSIPQQNDHWGISMKRFEVDFKVSNRPAIVCERREKLAEVVNMLATVERMLDALHWFNEGSDWPKLFVKECHPTTSSFKGGNDLVLADTNGKVVVCCEVTDVASSRAGQNGKERKDVGSLLRAKQAISPDVRLFLVTSPEFAQAIQSPKRRCDGRTYHYEAYVVGDTVLLEIRESV